MQCLLSSLRFRTQPKGLCVFICVLFIYYRRWVFAFALIFSCHQVLVIERWIMSIYWRVHVLCAQCSSLDRWATRTAFITLSEKVFSSVWNCCIWKHDGGLCCSGLFILVCDQLKCIKIKIHMTSSVWSGTRLFCLITAVCTAQPSAARTSRSVQIQYTATRLCTLAIELCLKYAGAFTLYRRNTLTNAASHMHNHNQRVKKYDLHEPNVEFVHIYTAITQSAVLDTLSKHTHTDKHHTLTSASIIHCSVTVHPQHPLKRLVVILCLTALYR